MSGSSVVRKGEDRLLVDTKQGLYGVFDGHMGSEASELVCHYFPKAFKHHKSMVSSEEQDLKLALRLALRDTDMELQDLDCGTTACVAVVTRDLVVVANVGDSRALLYGPRANGSLRLVKKLSEDHHPNVAVEQQRIVAAGGSVEGKRMWIPGDESLAVSRALGDRKFKKYGLSAEPEFKVWKRPGSDKCYYLVLATDGLFDRMSEAVVGELLEGQDQPEEQVMAVKIAAAAEEIDRRNKSSVLVPVPPEFEGPLPTPVEGGDDIAIVVVKV